MEPKTPGTEVTEATETAFPELWNVNDLSQTNIADMEISMSNYGDKYDNARVYFWRETTKQIKDNLGRILLQLDKQTADETIEAEIYARDLSRD